MNALMLWLSMGGYASYVWPAYGVVCALLVLNVIGCRWQKKRIDKSLQNWFKQTS